VHCLWWVVKTLTIILNNPVYIPDNMHLHVKIFICVLRASIIPRNSFLDRYRENAWPMLSGRWSGLFLVTVLSTSLLKHWIFIRIKSKCDFSSELNTWKFKFPEGWTDRRRLPSTSEISTAKRIWQILISLVFFNLCNVWRHAQTYRWPRDTCQLHGDVTWVGKKQASLCMRHRSHY